ncbi:hypothetical protein POM88_007534 [Heracleum sosnowskyi]|uniref:Uncharacterized protein n=1 Tax=Heracleum sosnowskyi TaxID=360622 RepID=A0AAD8J5N8_9APIA|nr:hypothetical protein POM88_007534 [Heracleum sosnowskyi]
MEREMEFNYRKEQERIRDKKEIHVEINCGMELLRLRAYRDVIWVIIDRLIRDNGNWEDRLPLIRFPYNNSYYDDFEMLPYDDLLSVGKVRISLLATPLFGLRVQCDDQIIDPGFGGVTMLLTDNYYNFSTQLMYELGAKLGDKKTRKNNIYYARFLMMLANHVSPTPLVISNPNSKFDCFVQEKRVLTDILRLNHNGDVPMVYLPVIEVTLSHPVNLNVTSISSTTTTVVAMESVVVTQQAPAPSTRPKSTNSKSTKPTSGASQKAPVVKSTTQPKGSEAGVVSGEGRGENQRNPKDKVGEVSVTQTSPIVSSQQGTMSNMDFSSSLTTSSQKGVVI